jgi:energy-coupling factor transporter ATP-binding protein EcfA2
MKVETLYVIAGPRGIGKTRFLEQCAAIVPEQARPAALLPLFAGDMPGFHLVDVGRFRSHSLPRAMLHLDIFTPFQDLPPSRPEALARMISPEGFGSCRDFDCLSEANELYVVTLRASRRTVLRRWLGRAASAGSVAVRTNLAQIYSDASGEQLFDHLYDAWARFLGTLEVAGHWVADVETSGPVSLVEAGRLTASDAGAGWAGP